MGSRVVVIGAGGHAHVVVDVLRNNTFQDLEFEPVGLIDRDVSKQGSLVLRTPVLGDESMLESIEHDGIIGGIGDNATRAAELKRLADLGEVLISAVHRAAWIAPDATMGAGVLVCPGAVINPLVTIDDDVIINTSASVDHHCHIGAHSHIAPGVRLGGECSVGPRALVGIGATVMPGRQIGEGATVGAGSTVTTNVAAGDVVVGSPARSLKNHTH